MTTTIGKWQRKRFLPHPLPEPLTRILRVVIQERKRVKRKRRRERR